MRVLMIATADCGLLVTWIPTILLSYVLFRWFVFFTSIKDYGLNDFATLFHVAVGFALTATTIVVGVFTAVLNAYLAWRLAYVERLQVRESDP